MKKKRFLILFMWLWSISLLAQVSTVWNYPIGPGSNEWKDKSINEQLSYYNVPESLLSKMTTEDLVKTCLNYPELRMIFTRNSFTDGYEYIKGQFNGFRELENRSDAGKYLLDFYKSKKHDDINSISDNVGKGKFIFSIMYVELLISQESIIKNMSKDDQVSLKNQAIIGFDSETRLNKNFGDIPLELPATILGRLLVLNSATNESLRTQIDADIISFAKNPNSRDKSCWLKVYNLAKATNHL